MSRQKLISYKIKDTVEHMLYEKSQGIITSYTNLIDKILNLYNCVYSKLEDKTISIKVDAETICDNAVKYKTDMMNCHENRGKNIGLGIDMDDDLNKINYYCYELVSKYINVERIMATM